MGTIKQGILGGFSGKVGNVIGGNWKGIDYMRIKPASVSNPQSNGQVDQRTRFNIALKYLQPLSQFLKIGFKSYAVKMTAFNSAMSYNLNNAMEGDYPDVFINHEKVLVARGTLTPALNAVATSTVAGQVVFTWVDNSGEGNALATDKAMLVVCSPETGEAVYSVDAANRSVATATITVPSSFSGLEVNCFLAFSTADQSVVSNSKYAGSIEVA